jgi:hypothetical protein
MGAVLRRGLTADGRRSRRRRSPVIGSRVKGRAKRLAGLPWWLLILRGASPVAGDLVVPRRCHYVVGGEWLSGADRASAQEALGVAPAEIEARRRCRGSR